MLYIYIIYITSIYLSIYLSIYIYIYISNIYTLVTLSHMIISLDDVNISAQEYDEEKTSKNNF